MATVFIARIKNGELYLGSDYNRARFNEWCKANEGKAIRIQRDAPIRSLSQNALYWSWLKKIELETGNDSEDMHIFFRSTFLPKRLVKIKGKSIHTVETLGSTTKLRKAEFSEYLDKCSLYVGIPLPTPEELESMGYLKN